MVTLSIDNEDIAAVRQCLRAAADGPFFPDWEFHTLMGSPRHEVRELAKHWPGNAEQERAALAIGIGVLNNLLGYPHGQESVWKSFISATRAEVEEVLERLLAYERHLR
jgi:hypothetical protein